MQKTPTFSVCSVMREPVFVVDCFIQHYLALGAERIIIVWDGLPDEDQRAQLESIAPATILKLVYCDDDFLNARGLERDKAALEDIQHAGYHYAYQKCDSDWMLFCDADEFLHTTSSLTELLEPIPSDVPSIHIRNLEAVWGLEDDLSQPFGSSYFRGPIKVHRLTRILTWMTLGRYAEFTRGGMMGHSSGKHLLRNGLNNASIKSHRTSIDGQRVGEWLHEILPEHSECFFAHFDAISEQRWVEKWRRRFSKERSADKMHAKRAAQQNLVKVAFLENKTSELFSRLYGLTRLQTFTLSRLGVLTRARPILGKARWTSPEYSPAHRSLN